MIFESTKVVIFYSLQSTASIIIVINTIFVLSNKKREQRMGKIVIAIDGFSACGKSTMAKSIAHKINYIYIDSGAMYRAVTFYCFRNKLIDNEGNVDVKRLQRDIDKIKITFKLDERTNLPVTYLNGENVEAAIRTMEISGKVSMISSLGFVRRAMVVQQQAMGKNKGLVMDGRDIGTVVFPTAELKIFVTAKPEIRAQRRLDELRAKGDKQTTFADVLKNLQERDDADQNRADSPLKKADDAIILDNSYMTIEQQMQWLLDLYNKTI